MIADLTTAIGALNTLSTTLNALITTFMNQHIDDGDSYVGINFAHHEVHEGNSYFIATLLATGGAALRSISFKTGIGRQLHLIINWNTESKATLTLTEGTAITATTGTQAQIYNKDRNSARMSNVLNNKSGAFVADGKVLIDATTVGGTVIRTLGTWSDRKQGSKDRGTFEKILKQDTEYEILITSNDGNKGLGLELNWYEHTPE